MSLKSVIELLQRHDLFAGIDPVRLEVLAFTAERPSFEAGDTLFEAGEEAHEAYLILEGQAVMLAHVGPLGGLPAPYDLRRGEARALRLERGDLVGESALLHAGARRSTVKASSRLETLAISRYLFQRLMEEFPEMASAIARALTERLAATGDEVRALANRLGRRSDRMKGGI